MNDNDVIEMFQELKDQLEDQRLLIEKIALSLEDHSDCCFDFSEEDDGTSLNP